MCGNAHTIATPAPALLRHHQVVVVFATTTTWLLYCGLASPSRFRKRADHAILGGKRKKTTTMTDSSTRGLLHVFCGPPRRFRSDE
ncbi:unnamed protein product [Sphagnum balticum]